MFFWFVATAFLAVLFIFDSPAIDYRFVILGGLLPLIEVPFGAPLILHTLLGSVVLLGLVMAATVGRRIRRRQLLGLPIGSFFFLVFGGAWTRTDLFWWPFAGLDGIAAGSFPEYDRPVGLLILLEAVGLVATIWIVVRFELLDRNRRDAFIKTGRLARELLR